jgi:tetratricopeptide (TPR) repeat protein
MFAVVDTATKIIREFEGMPLAIEIVGAFVITKGMGIRDFLPSYSANDIPIMKHIPSRTQWTYDRQRSMEDIVELLLDAVNDTENDAMSLLIMSSFLGSIELPTPIFSSKIIAQESVDAPLRKPSLDTLPQESHLAKKCVLWLSSSSQNYGFCLASVARLNELGLAKSRKTSDGRILAFTVHNLVRKWSNKRPTHLERKELVLLVAWLTSNVLLNSLNKGFSTRRDITLMETVLENIRKTIDSDDLLPLTSPKGAYASLYHGLCSVFATVYMQQTQYQKAQDLYATILQYELMRKPSGQPAQRPYLEALRDYGNAAWHNRDLTDAEATFKTLLENSPSSSEEANEFALTASVHLKKIYLRMHKLKENEDRAVLAMRNPVVPSTGVKQALSRDQMPRAPDSEHSSRQRSEHTSTQNTVNNLEEMLMQIREQGQQEDAVRICMEVLEKSRRILGDNHPNTITAMGNLALTLGDQGQLEEAARMQKETLEKSRRIFGDDHPDTITAMGNLALTLGDQGQLEEAARIQKETLEKRKRIFGDNHPGTITAISNLAVTLRYQGQLEKAARMQKETLEKWKRILGDNHPNTITAMGNLAVTLGDQGQLKKAARIQKETLEKRKRILGDDHPDTIKVMGNLAVTLGDQGQLEEAARMQKETLEKSRRILGDDHPDTITAMGNLALTLEDQDQLDKAARIQKETLEKSRRILGDDHPDTITAMGNFAVTLENQGQLEEATKIKKETLEKSRRILGDEHPNTITAMSNLALTFGNQGQLEETVKMQKEVLEKRRRILGEEHPNTIMAINNLAVTFVNQGQLDEAARMQKEVLEKRKRILGEEHPHTISTMSNLAITFRNQGQLDEAARMQKEVLERGKRISGEEHPDTRVAKADLVRLTGIEASPRHILTAPAQTGGEGGILFRLKRRFTK